MRKLRFGVLGTAKIAREKVIPAMQRGALRGRGARVARPGRAAEAGGRLGIAASTAATRRCSPILTSTRSTSRCPTTCTCRGRSGRPRPASTCCARSRSR